jgi:hypothetical protein
MAVARGRRGAVRRRRNDETIKARRRDVLA